MIDANRKHARKLMLESIISEHKTELKTEKTFKIVFAVIIGTAVACGIFMVTAAAVTLQLMGA